MITTPALCSMNKPPPSVVFDLTPCIAEYEEHIARMNVLVLDIHALLSDIVNYLRYEFFFPGELKELAANIINNSDQPLEEDVGHLYRAILTLGQGVYCLFKEHALFDDEAQHHYLFYNFINNQTLILHEVEYFQKEYNNS